MADETNISWADATFNPWIGCTRISPACDHCYAAALMGTEGRMGVAQWGGPGVGAGTRVRTSKANWSKPLTWNRKAAANGTRPFVFCASLADVFDNEVPAEWRRDLFDLIRATPHLTWLLLTKRPGNIVKMFAEQCITGTYGARSDQIDPAVLIRAWPRNAAVGCTVVSQEEADRDIPKLLAAKAALKPAFAFLSMEPLLGPVDLTKLFMDDPLGGCYLDALTRPDDPTALPGLDWIITGFETDQGGSNARPGYPGWIRAIERQCSQTGTAFHHKQNGEFLEEQQLAAAGIDPRSLPAHKVVVVDGVLYGKVGKKVAGRVLNGRTYDARPST